MNSITLVMTTDKFNFKTIINKTTSDFATEIGIFEYKK